MKNVVFIGMPGCGKTTISNLIADALSRPFFDSDVEIEAEEQMSISDIFHYKGEDYFRVKETKILSRLLNKQDCVISTGGGAILKNSELLRKNSFIIYLFRNVQNILTTLDIDTRPLLTDKNKLYELYKKRHPLYERTCDVYIDNNSDIETTVSKILEVLL